MKDLRISIGIKFGAILTGIHVLLSLIVTLLFSSSTSQNSPLILLITALNWTALGVSLILAHYEFNNKNEKYISFKDAIIIGLIIVAIGQITSLILNYINYELFLKEKLEAMYASQFSAEVTQKILASQFSVISLISGFFLSALFMFFIITAEAYWKIYKKAGKEGWACLVPIYNLIVYLEIIGKPIAWLIFLFIPGVNIIFAIWMVNLLAKRFGQSEGFTIGMLLLPFIFYPLLGMSKLEYQEPEEY